MTQRFTGPLLAALALGLAGGPALACTTTIGVVMSLTGPAGSYGQAGAKAVQMAFSDINKAGGAAGCDLAADVRDAQTSGSVAADQAKQLVDVGHVPGIIGGIISSVTIPILTAVTAPAKVPQISPASSSPTLTTMGEEGKTNGIFFRTITSDALQGVVAAQYALSLGYKKLAIIHVNNDFGANMVREFSAAYTKLGGTITSDTPYNEKESSYAAEVTAAMAGKPDALYLVSYPVDGATIARAWISQGGPQKFLLNDGMNSADFIKAVGAKYLNPAFGTSSGTEPTPSTAYFEKNFKTFSKLDPGSPGAVQSYDAAAIMGLAVAIAGKPDPAAITAGIRAAVDPKGTPVTAGPDGFRKALALIKAHKPIRYVGVIGPISFDKVGDITGPFAEWKIAGGKIVTTAQVSTADVAKLMAKLGQ
jgi:branched-chain amino acid transport system substrate-binding protein